jgi:hypothetical protein
MSILSDRLNAIKTKGVINYTKDFAGGLKLQIGNAMNRVSDRVTDFAMQGSKASKELNSLRNDTINKYDYTPEAKNILGKQVLNFLPNMGGATLGSTNIESLPNWSLDKSAGKGPEDRMNQYRKVSFNPSVLTAPPNLQKYAGTTTMSHEFAHQLNQVIPEQTGKTINLGEFYGEWNKEVNSNPTLKEIDDNIKNWYPVEVSDDPMSVAQERYAFLAELATKNNKNIIPTSLKKYYSSIYNFNN